MKYFTLFCAVGRDTEAPVILNLPQSIIDELKDSNGYIVDKYRTALLGVEAQVDPDYIPEKVIKIVFAITVLAIQKAFPEFSGKENSPVYELVLGPVELTPEIQQAYNIPDEPEEPLHTLPNSQGVKFYEEYLAHGVTMKNNTPQTKTGVFRLEKQSRKATHSSEYTVSAERNGAKIPLTVTKTRDKYDTTIKQQDINLLSGSNEHEMKLLLYTMENLPSGIYKSLHGANAKMEPVKLEIQLKDLVDNGAYSDIRQARKGVASAIQTFAGSSISKSIHSKDPKKAGYVETLPILASLNGKGSRVYDTIPKCEVIYDAAALKILIDQNVFTIIPDRYIYRLSPKAMKLTYTAFHFARINCESIAKYHSFSLSMWEIVKEIDLPVWDSDRKKTQTKDANRDIKKPIEDAVNDINMLQQVHYGNTDFRIRIDADMEAPIAEFLDGRLTFFFDGAFYDYMLKRWNTRSHKEKEEEGRKKGIQTKAETKALTNALEKIYAENPEKALEKFQSKN